MTHDDDEYLVEGTGTPDPAVRRLEEALRPLGRAEGAEPPPFGVRPAGLRRLPYPAAWLVAGAAAVLLVCAVVFTQRGDRDDVALRGAESATDGVALGAGSWIETSDAAHELSLGALSEVTIGPRSRVQIRRVGEDETRLYLAQGQVEARVSAAARPRFFQIDTDAARCVDLGCRYTLDVDDDGTATVRVTTGQVAFEHDGRDVFIPAGASCVARRGKGPGTPRFDDAPVAVVDAFDAYDGAIAASAPPAVRRDLAVAALATVRSARDTLSAWHLFGTGVDAEVGEVLARITGEAAPLPADQEPRAIWRERLAGAW